MRMLKILKSKKLFSHQLLNNRPEKSVFKIPWDLSLTIKILVVSLLHWLKNIKISNGNMMLKAKRNKVTMKILNKNLLLKIFLKWISKSFWTMKILKPKIKISKKIKNQKNKNKRRKKTNKKPNKKCKSKMVKRFKKKAKIKNNHQKRKKLGDLNMNLSQILTKNSSKYWKSSSAFLMILKSYFMSEKQLVVPKEKLFWFHKESEDS